MSKQTNIFTVFDGTSGDVELRGTGSVYTYIASGSAGQTATVEGSVDGELWVSVVTLTVGDSGSVQQTLQHVLPYLRVAGNARVQISRGNA